MQDNEPKLTDQQKEELDESLKRGGAFEEMTHGQGWEYIKVYYQNKVQAFASGILMSDKTDIDIFEAERREIIGLRKLLGYVDSDLSALMDFRKKNKKDASDEKPKE